MASVKDFKYKKKLQNGKSKTHLQTRISVVVGGETKRFSYNTQLNKKQKIKLEKLLNDLEGDNLLGGEPSPETMNKVMSFDGEFISKLEGIGLIPKQDQEILKLEKFFEYLIKKNQAALERAEIVKDTLGKRTNTQNQFVNYLKKAGISVSDIRKLTVEDCKNYRDSRLGSCASETVATEVKQLRQMFEVAIDMDILTKNPFKKVKVKTTDKNATSNRREFINPQLLQDALDAIPTNSTHEKNNAVWFALLRWTGARRSEPLLLKWKMVDWEKGRITMPAPKTTHSGLSERQLPFFKELKPILEQHWHNQNRPSPEAYVIHNVYSKKCTNLPSKGRTAASVNEVDPNYWWTKWFDAAGVKVWQKLSQNLRVSRENELLQSGEYRPEAVHAFIGHSREVYLSNYKQLNDDDFVALSDRTTAGKGKATIRLPDNAQKRPTKAGATSNDKKKDPTLADLVDNWSEGALPANPLSGERVISNGPARFLSKT